MCSAINEVPRGQRLYFADYCATKNSIKVLERISNTVVKFDLGLLYSMWFSSSEIQIMLGAALYRMTSPATRTRVTSSSPPTLCSYSSRWVPSTATLNMSSSTRIFSCRESDRKLYAQRVKVLWGTQVRVMLSSSRRMTYKIRVTPVLHI